MQGGNYINFEDSIGINPLLLEDTQANKSFLADFIAEMASATDPEKAIINETVPQFFEWSQENLKIENIINSFPKESKNLIKKLSQWCNDGVYSSYFGSKNSSILNTNEKMTVLDFTNILDHSKILGLMTSYITHNFFGSCDGTPRIIFIDEFRRYLESDIFAKLAERLMQEIRKLNGVFICAVQSLDHLYQNEAGKKNLGNFGKFILFPSREALNPEAYIDGIGLNEEEFMWLKTAEPSSRQVMIKTAGGSSTRIYCNLKFLGKYLKVYDSGADSVNKLKKLMKTNPKNYQELFLAS